jgi:superfamily II DNA or RNA helicase
MIPQPSTVAPEHAPADERSGSAQFSDLVRSLSPDPVIRGREFEEICRWLLLNSPVYRSRIRTVWRWDEWPGRWGADAGIDLVAEEYDGSLWAIQAKAYAPEYAITKADVDSFLSESARPQFSFRLLIATTNRLGATARRTIWEQEKPASLLMLGDLELANADWPSSPGDLRPARPLRRLPRPHQNEAIRSVLNGFQNFARGQLLMACGTGKTLTSLWISEALGSQRTLILVPSLSLLSQALQVWLTNSTEVPGYIAVCSDESVARGADELLESASDIGVPVTTDPRVIAAFLRSDGPRMVFATYQSSPKIAEAMREGFPPFDLVVADEAHRVAGPSGGAFGAVLDDQAIRARRRLFMTATPRIYSERVRRAALDADFVIASMDDPETFGPVFHHLSFAEAIRRDLLADYQVVVVAVTDATYRDYADRGLYVTIDGETVSDARRLASEIGLAKAMRDFNLSRTISFHHRVKGASEFAQSFPQVVAWMPEDERPPGGIWAKKISGDMPSGERDVLLSQFRSLEEGQRGLLTNARCLAEGVDIPSIDGVAFLDPRRSQIDVVQAVGRSIRKSPTKTVGMIIVPVFIDPDEDPETVLESSAFEPVWAVLKALRSHDEVLAEELDELRRGLGQRAAARIQLPGKLHLELPESVDEAFARAFETRIVEETTSSWEASFGVLERLVERTGTALIPRDLVDAGIPIGRWVSKQRSRSRAGVLTPDRIRRLETLAGWEWDPHLAAWEEGFSHLQRFTDREKHAQVSAKYREDGYPLGQWVNVMRTLFQRGHLPRHRIERLEALPDWSWNGRQAQWEKAFDRLLEYEQEHGNVRVSHEYRVDGVALGNWVVMQRRFLATGKLSTERMARLESLQGWSWNTLEDSWALGLERLSQFRAREGHTLVSQKHDEDGFALGAWVARQRTGKSKLTPGRLRLLEEIDGWTWNAVEDLWLRNFGLLKEYAHRERHTQVPYDAVIDDVKLGNWVWKQRQDGLSGKLRADRHALLEQIPSWEWESSKDIALWERNFQQLQRSPHLFGSTGREVAGSREDRLLREWVAKQRRAYRKGTIDARWEARLQTLPGWRWEPEDKEWTQGLAALRVLAEREGHTCPRRSTEVDGFPLGFWISTQRQHFTLGKLNVHQQRELEAVPGWSWRKDLARSTPKPDPWEQGRQVLSTFYAQRGNAQVLANHVQDGFRLGSWVSKQRQLRRDGMLPEERVRYLESLDGWSWHPKREAWEDGYQALISYVKRQGHAVVPKDHVEGDFKLGAWVGQQRTAYKDGHIRPDRMERLQALPSWSWSRRDLWWEEGYAHLRQFYQREGHTTIRPNYVENDFKLGRWVANQRTRSKNQPERAKRLEEFPDWYWFA